METNLIHWSDLIICHDGEILCSLGKFIEKFGEPENGRTNLTAGEHDQ